MGQSPRRYRLFWRVYLHNFSLLTVIALTLAAVENFIVSPVVQPALLRFVNHFALEIAQSHQDPEQLERRVKQLHQELGINISVYDSQDRLLSSSATPAITVSPENAQRSLRGESVRDTSQSLVVPLQTEGKVSGYVVFNLVADVTWRSGVVVISSVLLLLILISIPLIRAISRPLENLVEKAQALGRGDLRARATVGRQDEIGDLAVTFNEMADRISSQILAEKELLANISHELRTPMARIRVALDLAAEDKDDPAQYFTGIADDLRELEGLVNDVLTATRLDLAAHRTGESIPLRRELLDSELLLSAAIERFSDAHPSRELMVSFEKLPTIYADKMMLRRALDNLLDNAQKYSDPAHAVSISAREEGSLLVIRIADKGIGLTKEEQQKLFQPFFRADRSRNRETGGLGLGLVLVKRIIQAHEGEIFVQSKPTEGTTFTITLQVSPPGDINDVTR
jgi:two-component system, OmpR family, sensor kinase